MLLDGGTYVCFTNDSHMQRLSFLNLATSVNFTNLVVRPYRVRNLLDCADKSRTEHNTFTTFSPCAAECIDLAKLVGGQFGLFQRYKIFCFELTDASQAIADLPLVAPNARTSAERDISPLSHLAFLYPAPNRRLGKSRQLPAAWQWIDRRLLLHSRQSLCDHT
jgi:hypothetical protein